MTTRKRYLTIGVLLVAAMLLAVLVSTRPPVEPPLPDVAESPPAPLPGPVPAPPSIAEVGPPEAPVAPSGAQPEGDPILLEVLDEDSVRISGEVVRAAELVQYLALLADEDRHEGSWNRVSRRELVVRAPADSRWGAVRRFLLLAAGPKVRIYRVFVALPEGPPVAISVRAGWVSAEQPDSRRRTHIECSVQASLQRNPGDEHTRLELLGRDVGTGPAAFATLRETCIKILASPGNELLSADLVASGTVSFGEVVETLSTFWSVGHPAVYLDCLMPPYGMWPIGTSGWDFEEKASLRSGEERTVFLLDGLWSGSGLKAITAEYLLLREGVAALPALLARMERDGMPPREHRQIVDGSFGTSGPNTALLYSFGEDAVPLLIRAASSPSAAVRGIVLRALSGFPESGPEVEEVIRWAKDSDPDPEVRQKAQDALQHLLSARRGR